MTESSINTERILINHFIYNLKITIIYLLNKYAHNQDELLSGVNMMIDMFVVHTLMLILVIMNL